MKELRSGIEIQASAQRMWQLLADFPSFPKWTPFIRHASGNRLRFCLAKHPENRRAAWRFSGCSTTHCVSPG